MALNTEQLKPLHTDLQALHIHFILCTPLQPPTVTQQYHVGSFERPKGS